ncbi:hypothetical protein M951_chr356 (nucleomorph) [Lotharella oceanica]|uniref:Uncharacterized protein n=1 Tax=Lotharella oceanica TaxID=641309 RepID=A0A060DB66_9EUKA|nr:hypothetical protein M951_chr356 [Lotharella oceanica]|mmetsp:Transcript_15777/g.29957  ORF Transcript_15777/g.29957 Transcript_15777/m.29957 type:complete len:236 (-) Transcript_15777:523-1230(-)
MHNIQYNIKKNNNTVFKRVINAAIKKNLNNKYESFMFLKIKNVNLNSKYHKINFKPSFIHDKITRINYTDFRKNLHIHSKQNDLFNILNVYEKKRNEHIFQDKFLFIHQLHQEIFFNSFVATLNYSAIIRFMEIVYTKNATFYSLYPQWYNSILSSEKNIHQFISDTILAETKLFLTYKKYNTISHDYYFLDRYNNGTQTNTEKKYKQNNNFVIQKYINISDTILIYLISKCLNY